MERTRRLIDYYLPPGEGFVLESLVATTYQVDFEFFEEDLLPAALGVRSPLSRLRAFRSELERQLQRAEVSVLYDLRGCDRLARVSPRIDPIPVATRKLHSKVSLLMWIRENRGSGAPAERRMRLLVGSANLTRQGFRHNYECVVSVDFGGRHSSRRALLTTAIALVEQISADSKSPQLARQLALFSSQTSLLPRGTAAPDDPVALVAANEVLPAIRKAWSAMSSKAPDTVTIVSPFWAEGAEASEALFGLLEHIGSPENVHLVCRGEKSANGKAWLPVFDPGLAVELKRRLKGRLFLRASLPDSGTQPSLQQARDDGDETEEAEFATPLGTGADGSSEVHRPLHAKLIIVEGTAGSVLYAGSSNCTRRGLGLGGPSNFEAGFVYRLTSRQRRQIDALLVFAGPAKEVVRGISPGTCQPPVRTDPVVPTFLADVVASGMTITVRFRGAVPPDLVLLMPIPGTAGDNVFWLLYDRSARSGGSPDTLSVELDSCPRCNERLEELAPGPESQPVQPHVFIDVRWEGHTTKFPVRFDDKTRLPLLLAGRRPSEGELIEYFLFGKEPGDSEAGSGAGQGGANQVQSDNPIDTRRILAYFIRRFTQAIPGIEAELRRGAYSRASLDAVLRGPTSPLELAERAYESLSQAPGPDSPAKTPTAVGFQLMEILAVLQRGRSLVTDPDLRVCFDPVAARCQTMLHSLVASHSELRAEGFQLYLSRILESAR